MQDSLVASRYAEALCGLEGTDLKKIEEDLSLISEIFSSDEQNFEFFVSPMISPEDKKKVIKNCFENKVSENVLKLLMLLIDKKRESEIVKIYHQFLSQNDLGLNRTRAELTLSRDFPKNLDSEVKGTLMDFIRKYQGSFGIEHLNEKSDIEFKVKVDESLLGGVKIRIGDQYLDASIANYLEVWKKRIKRI